MANPAVKVSFSNEKFFKAKMKVSIDSVLLAMGKNLSGKKLASMAKGTSNALAELTKKKINIEEGDRQHSGFATGSLRRSIRYLPEASKIVRNSNRYKSTVTLNLDMEDYGFIIAEAKYKFGASISKLAQWILKKVSLGINDFYYTNDEGNRVDVVANDVEGAELAAKQMSLLMRVKKKKGMTRKYLFEWYKINDKDIQKIMPIFRKQVGLKAAITAKEALKKINK